jgi:hypothetical protein
MKKPKKLYRCKQCKKPGHNRATCPKLAHTRTCTQCKIVGHDAVDCPMRKPCVICGSRKHSVRKHPGGFTATLIAGKRVVVQPLVQPGTDLVHIAYEPKTFTLEVAYRGKWAALLRYRYTKVQPVIVDQLRAAKHPIEFIEHMIKPTARERFVVPRGRGSSS